MSCDVVITASGAPAMRDRASGEIMHPGTGAAVEPVELYVLPSRLEARLRAPDDGAENGGAPLVVLDAGLGAASNAIAAWRLTRVETTCAARSSARTLASAPRYFPIGVRTASTT